MKRIDLKFRFKIFNIGNGQVATGSINIEAQGTILYTSPETPLMVVALSLIS